MALPKTKYSSPLHTPGGEFLLDGKDYIGWYIKTYQNKFYSGKTFDSFSQQLQEKKDIVPPSLIFAEQHTEPDSYARNKGVWRRYFIQKKSNLKIIEVTKERYDTFKNISQYSRGILEWKIKGPSENQNIKGYTYFGAAHVNEVNTKSLENSLTGISSYIKDYSQFVE